MQGSAITLFLLGVLVVGVAVLFLIWRTQRSQRWKREFQQSDHLSRETERCIAFAGVWWAYTLVTNPNMLYGHPRTSEILTDTAMHLTKPDPNQIRRFRQLLEQQLREQMLSRLTRKWPPDWAMSRADVERCTIASDPFHPAPPGLYEAGRQAGIDHLKFRLPAKTVMEIERGNVYLSYGQGSRKKRIYPHRSSKTLIQFVESYQNNDKK